MTEMETAAQRRWTAWTQEEDAILLDEPRPTRKELALQLGRSPAAISSRLKALRELGKEQPPTNGSIPEASAPPGTRPQAAEPEASEEILTTQEDDAYRFLDEAMWKVVRAMQTTLDESVMQACGNLLYQIRRVQARLE